MAAQDKLLPMLIEGHKGTVLEDVEANITKYGGQETKRIHAQLVFSMIPVRGIEPLRKLARLRNLDDKHPLFKAHDVLMVRACLLERAMAQFAKENIRRFLGDDLRGILEDSEDSRQDFKNGISTAHLKFKQNQDALLEEAIELIGKKDLIEKLIALAQTDLENIRLQDKVQAAKLNALIADLTDDLKEEK